MNLLESISDKRSMVTILLWVHPHLRDDDLKLMANIWRADIRKLNYDPEGISGYDFLKLFSQGRLTNPETIRRVRQKIQEEQPELRGKSHQMRKEQAETIRKNI